MGVLRYLVIVILAVSCLWPRVRGVDRKKFRTCAQTGFCDRHRNDFRDEEFMMRDLKPTDGRLFGTLWPRKHPLQTDEVFVLEVLKSGAVHFYVKEPKNPRYEVNDVLQDGVFDDIIPVDWVEDPLPPLTESGHQPPAVGWTGTYTFENDKYTIRIVNMQFEVTLKRNDEDVIVLNHDNKFDFEQNRDKLKADDFKEKKELPPEEEGLTATHRLYVDKHGNQAGWEEEFDGHEDHVTHGPQAIALDVTFPNAKHVYGVPEHTTSYALKNTNADKKSSTAYSEPYRLFNLDVFEFELDEPMALYGSVPFLMSHSIQTGTAGMLWLNAAETFVDIYDSEDLNGKTSYWISETGNVDLFLFPGPTSKAVFKQYTDLTGTSAMPQQFAIAYHQCRWNYKNEEDVNAVDNGFDDYDIPYDVLWLDIEHTDGKKYFTWDHQNFPTPEKMQDSVAEKGRKMVTIVDPHIKRDNNYHVHTEAQGKYYVKDAQGNKDFEGWCWPGSVSYLDFMRSDVRDYWAGMFALDKYKGSTLNLYTWNDMNEPSVFNGPEVTMPKGCKHMEGRVEHRAVHNQYGYWQHMATAQGQIARNGNARPFVLSRAFFAGTQRVGAIWTGDNTATWEHMASSVPMLLSLNTAGIVFSGADVGGFFGDPSPELLARWYQLGAFQPFFRGHAHIDTKRREPWLFGEPYTSVIRDAIRSRYALLPYLYSVFAESSFTGNAIMRAMWMEFPGDESLFATEDQFLLGDSVLMKPVTKEMSSSMEVLLPHSESTDVWYEFDYPHTAETKTAVTVATPLEKINAFFRGGRIIPMKLRPRRSSALMVNDPYTFVVALNGASQSAEGELYLDDGESFDYRTKGAFQTRVLKFTSTDTSSTLTSTTKVQDTFFDAGTSVERITVLGLKKAVKQVVTDASEEISFSQSFSPDVLTIKKPGVLASRDFTLSLIY